MGFESRAAINDVMRDKVIPLLQEYFFEDWGRIHGVLGDGFIGSRKIAPPPGIDGDERDSWFGRGEFLDDAFERLNGKAAAVTPPE